MRNYLGKRVTLEFGVRKRNMYGLLFQNICGLRKRRKTFCENHVRKRIPYPSTHSGVCPNRRIERHTNEVNEFCNDCDDQLM